MQAIGCYHAATIRKTDKMNIIEITPKIAKAIRSAVSGQKNYICIGRSRNSAAAGSGTPIIVTTGGSAPRLAGLPYLKTNFVGGGGFRKTLYTPSTLRIEVGAEWIAALAIV